MEKYVSTLLLTICINLLIYYNLCPVVVDLCEMNSCPSCFGTDLCAEIKKNKILLQYNSILDMIYNMISVKNVYFARYSDRKVVLKKLTHDSELRNLVVLEKKSLQDLLMFLISDIGVKNFRICNIDTANSFLQMLGHKNKKILHTLLLTNVEPLLLEIFDKQDGWPVPRLYGYCGRVIVVENAGQTLNNVESFTWFRRAYVAYQILEAMNNFTDNHEIFRLYLTDVSPDNIAVNEDLKISFIDLENAVLKKKNDNGGIHYTEHFEEDEYMYSERNICESSISDHNIYAACRLLLSKEAPWPMMKNGLLHSPPDHIKENFGDLLSHIELCVYSPNRINRFQLADAILNDLNYVLKNYTKFLN